MNERIKELYGNALDKAVPYTWHNLDHVEVEKIMQEFAELIVRECLDIALKSGHITNKDILAKVEAERIYHKIQEHFGVEA